MNLHGKFSIIIVQNVPLHFLDPAFTMVVYTGREAWDGARTLKEMLNLTGLDRMIQKMIADYPINLLEGRSWVNLEWFRSDIKEVFGFLKYTQDKEQLRNFIEENQKAFSDMEEEKKTNPLIWAGAAAALGAAAAAVVLVRRKRRKEKEWADEILGSDQDEFK